MKKILIVIVLTAFGTVLNKAYSQYYSDEYKFWSIKVGATHTFLESQPEQFDYFFVKRLTGDVKFIPADSYMGYVPGVFGGLYRNFDFQNNKNGLTFGLEVSNFGISSKYVAEYSNPDDPPYLIESFKVTQASGIVYFKFFNKYTTMRYLYAGAKFDYNFLIYKTEVASWDKTTTKRIKLDKTNVINFNVTPTIGFNWNFFNFELTYPLGGFLNTDSETTLYTNTVSVKPLGGQPKNVFVFRTSLNIPLNSWTSNTLYDIGPTIRKWFN